MRNSEWSAKSGYLHNISKSYFFPKRDYFFYFTAEKPKQRLVTVNLFSH